MFFLFLSEIVSHDRIYKCKHDEFFKNQKIDVEEIKVKRKLNSGKEPIRVLFDFNTIEKNLDPNQCTRVGESKYNGYGTEKCTENDIMTPERTKMLKDTLQNLADHLKELVQVTPFTSSITLSRSSYYPYDPRSIKGYDLVITVFCRPYGDTDVLAAATYTKTESSERRPIHGVMYVNPKEIPKEPISKDSPVRYFYDVVMHETFHVMGIAQNLFNSWRDPDTGKSYTKMFEDAKLPEYPGKTFRLFQTPYSVKVSQRRFGRKYFVDKIPMGIELETLGGGGTEYSHVKGRTYYNEMMSGIILPPTKLSEITLALLKDTGWYDVNWDKAEPLAWGDGLSFSDKPFSEFPVTPPDQFPENYLCPPWKNKKFVCNFDYTGVSECGVPTYFEDCPGSNSDQKEICKARSWYDSTNLHHFGPVDTFDFMRLLKAREYLMCSRRWTNGYAKEGDLLRATYGSDSSCYEIKYFINDTFKESASCYNTQCVDGGIKLTTSDNIEFTCRKKGEYKTSKNLTIVCPDPDLVCRMRKFNNKKVKSPEKYVFTPTPLPSSQPFNNQTIDEEEDDNEDEKEEKEKIVEKSDNSLKKIILVETSIIVICMILLVVCTVLLCKKRKYKMKEGDKDIEAMLNDGNDEVKVVADENNAVQP